MYNPDEGEGSYGWGVMGRVAMNWHSEKQGRVRSIMRRWWQRVRVSRVVCNPSREDGEGGGMLADLRNCRPTSRILISNVYRSIVNPHRPHSPVNTRMSGLPSVIFSKYFQNIILFRQICRWGFSKPRLLPKILGWPLVLKTAVIYRYITLPPLLSFERGHCTRCQHRKNIRQPPSAAITRRRVHDKTGDDFSLETR